VINGSVLSGGGAITVEADNDVNFGAAGTLDVEMGGAGPILVVSDDDDAGGGAITMADGAFINGRTGDITLDSTGNVTLGELFTLADVTIDSGMGSILDTADADANDITADTALLNGATGVGQGINFLETTLAGLEADAGTGGLWLTNTGDLEIGNVDAGTTGITANGNVAVDVAGVVLVTEPIDSNGGNVVLSATADVAVFAPIDSDGGTITLHSDTDSMAAGGIAVTSMVNSAGGDITLGGGADPAMNPAMGTVATEDGVIISGGTLNAGAGNISIRGESAVEDGVDIRGASSVSTTIGTITITGTSTGAMGEDGVQIMDAGTTITSATGLVTIQGTGSGQDGVDIQGGAVVSSTGMAAAGITIAGMASSTMESGVEIENAGSRVTSVTGPIQIMGMNPGDLGVIVADGAVVSSTGTGATAAPITIMGTGEVGVALVDAGTQVTSVDGDIMVNGAGSPGPGTALADGASVSSTGATSDAATITIMGTSDGDDGTGLFTGAAVTSVNGDIQIDGDASGGGDDGVHLDSTSTVTSTGTGMDAADIQITGTGGSDVGVQSDGMVSSVDGDVQITGTATNDDAVVVGGGSVQSTGTGDVTLTSNDSAATGDDLTVLSGATVQTATGDVILRSGDDLAVDSGATVTAGGQLRIEADFADADGGTGADVTLEGAISTVTPARILGGADNDTFTLDPDSTTGSLQIDGQGGDDSYDVFFGNLGGQVDIDDQAAEGTDDLILWGSGMPNVFTIGATQTTLGAQTVTYTANLEDITVEGEGGADTFDVTPSTTATIDLLGGDPTMAPGDTVNFMTPAGQSVAVTPDGADGGTFSTSGGFLDVTFDEIEAVSFTGDSLIVNSGGNDDLFDVTLTGADSGTLALTTDVDGVPGPTALINIMFSGLERLVANGEGGDDVFRQNNTGGPLGLLNGMEFNGGTGSDTLETLGGTATDVIHTFANSSDGSITIDAFGLTYTGLEPILDTITATTRTFTFAGTDDDITLSDLGGGVSRISSVSSSETVDFVNPTSKLTINAGDGADSFDGSASAIAATINGGAGNDSLTGTQFVDQINGGDNDDELTGGVGNDDLNGDGGNDLFIWNNGDGSDVVDGGADTDELEVNGSTVSPAGDTITISANGSRFDLTRAAGGMGLGPFSLDVGTIETLDLNTLDGEDSVTVGDLTGVDDLVTLLIETGAGNDTVDASALPDLGLSILIEGGDDDDTLTGAAGPSMINGNMGNDELNGGAAADTIMGGGGGDDVMNGGAGGDMLSGQAGDDTMTGGLGDDTMNGGADTDRIVESRDADFDLGDASLTISPSETDTLVDVEEADLNGGAAANTIDASDFSGTTATAAT
jgi:hypothetical protein